jgi:acetyl-CoA C-acetyltransferase
MAASYPFNQSFGRNHGVTGASQPAASSAWIVGTGHARTAPARDDVNTTELAWEAVSAALADAGVELAQIEGAVTASQDFWEGRTISSMAVNEIAGGTLGSEAKVAADGVMAVLYAMARIEDGDQHLNLIVAHSKESQADPHSVELAGFDPYFERALDPDETIAAALQASLYYARSGRGPEDAARVVAAARARRKKGSDLGGWAYFLEAVSVADVLASRPTASPLRELDRAPRVDAATALVVCDDATAERLGRPAVRLVAGAARSGGWWTGRDLTRAPELSGAVGEALERAGWELPDRVELNAPYAHQQLILAEELGLGGPEAFEDGLTPTGGWLAGSAGTVAGLEAVARAARAGGRALVHGTTGICGQSHAVVLLEGA